MSTYRDMHKINEHAEALYKLLGQYELYLEGELEYGDRDELHMWVNQDHYADDPGAALEDAREAKEKYEELYPDEHWAIDLLRELEKVRQLRDSIKLMLPG